MFLINQHTKTLIGILNTTIVKDSVVIISLQIDIKIN